jgi:hypothetical protein
VIVAFSLHAMEGCGIIQVVYHVAIMIAVQEHHEDKWYEGHKAAKNQGDAYSNITMYFCSILYDLSMAF